MGGNSLSFKPKLALIKNPATTPPTLWKMMYSTVLGNIESLVVNVAMVMNGLTWPPDTFAVLKINSVIEIPVIMLPNAAGATAPKLVT